ncbi:MAG: hypothetical protein RBQ69_09125, partial [Candidatus Cloacimonadaceae bacterium]|nr:hypothetical protein [Candidatus Cloacimonadaceae bacterium]
SIHRSFSLFSHYGKLLVCFILDNIIALQSSDFSGHFVSMKIARGSHPAVLEKRQLRFAHGLRGFMGFVMEL